MTTRSLPNDQDLFNNNFGEWLEDHGTEVSPMLRGSKFVALVDLNELKPAIMALITARENAARLEENERWRNIYLGALKSITAKNSPLDSAARGFIKTLTHHIKDFDDRITALSNTDKEEVYEQD